MGKKKKGHKMSTERKYLKKGLKWLGVGLGSAVALTPLSRAVVRTSEAGGDGAHKFNVFTDAVGNEYLGLQSDGHWDFGKAFQGVASVAGGIGLMWLFGQIGKRV